MTTRNISRTSLPFVFRWRTISGRKTPEKIRAGQKNTFKFNIIRFIKYSLVGLVSFSFSLASLFVLTNYLKIYYLTSTAISLVFGICLNYAINFVWVFGDSKVKSVKRHTYFLLFGAIAMVLTLLFMKFFVDIVNIYYLIARTMAGVLVGVLSFFMNSFFTFKILSLRPKNIGRS